MLIQLNISNFALIDKVTIDFKEGLNILTGETGTGKSILIDAITYMLGGKYNRNIIRAGEDKTFVEGVFDNIPNKTIKIIQSLDIPVENSIIIYRETSKEGRSIVKINNRTVIISELRKIAETLLDIHGQHENTSLLDSSTHIDILDQFCLEKIETPKKEYIGVYNEYKDLNQKLAELLGTSNEPESVKDFLKFQINEIEDAKLKKDEDLTLRERYKTIQNSDNISKVLTRVVTALKTGNDVSSGLIDEVGLAHKELQSIRNTNAKLDEISNSFDGIIYLLQENAQVLMDMKDTIVYDETELDQINSRLFLIDNIKRKYGQTIDDVLDKKCELLEKLDNIENRDKKVAEINSQIEAVKKVLEEKARVISEVRNNQADYLIAEIENELKELGLGKAKIKLKIDFSEKNISSNGFDNVNFLIATNPGQGFEKLNKIVSGGELSRIMLALKVVSTNKLNIPTIIFDEIDTGISGAVASAVAEKMYYVSRNTQVLVVTHLPQIAVMSDNHFRVEKTSTEDKTYSHVKSLDFDGKVSEITKMISGNNMTELSRRNALEMINISNKRKKNIVGKS